MRWVLDTNIVASAMLWGGKPLRLLQAARDRRVDLFASTPLLAELTDLLGRRKFEAKIVASGLSVDELVDRYAALAAMVRHAAVPRVVERDPDDDHVIACAIAAQADAIVSGDRHLLDLGQHQGIVILTAAQALARLQATE